jgi:TonB family protein
MKFVSTIVATFLMAGVATAKDRDNEQATPTSNDSAHAMDKPASNVKIKTTDKKTTTIGLSNAAYARLLAAALRRQVPISTQHRGGSVTVAFMVGASGRVISHSVKHASDPALEATVDQILVSVQAPPPPRGSFSAVQEFNFH